MGENITTRGIECELTQISKPQPLISVRLPQFTTKINLMEATLKNTQKQIAIAIGTISLVIGIVGLVLPVLPGVPFILFSEFCFGWAATL